MKNPFKELVGEDNKILLAGWCMAVAVILGMGLLFSSESVSILGVAESREFQVNFSNSVEIKHMHVMPGQTVKKGDLLAELSQSELELQLRTLRSRADRLAAELKLRGQISAITNETLELPSAADPLKTEWLDTKQEIILLENRLKNLFVFAEVDGTVGAVNFKDGEKAPSFAALITLHPLNPTYVNGYINENLQSHIEIGQKVEVKSGGGKSIQGVVVSMGSRIVPIPERLLRIQSLPAWGREVVVQIPPVNPFLLGEKVSVQKTYGISLFSTAQADEKTGKSNVTVHEPAPVEFPDSLMREFHPEISGMIFIPELKQFLLVSDDYPQQRPEFLLMNLQGQIQTQRLQISGLERMEDIESVSYDGENIYLLSSLSPTKKGQVKKARHMFAKVHRRGMDFILENSIDLRESLVKAMSTSKDPDIQHIFALQEELEIEGHAIQGDELLIALKNPLSGEGESVLLSVSNFQGLFEDGRITSDDVKVLAKLKLRFPDRDVQLTVTDMIVEGDVIYLASSCRKEDCSAIWRLHAVNGAVQLVSEFKIKHLEAIELLPSTEELYGFFESKKGSHLVRVKVK